MHQSVILLTYQRKLQVYSLMGVETAATIKLTHPIYTKYYPDIYFKLNRAQRSSYELIHGHVEAANSGIDRVTELGLAVSKDFDEKRFNSWVEAVQTEYHNARVLQWHIQFHLANRDNPDLGGLNSEAHKEYLKALDESREAIKQIIEKAKGFKREDFLKPYHSWPK